MFASNKAVSRERLGRSRSPTAQRAWRQIGLAGRWRLLHRLCEHQLPSVEVPPTRLPHGKHVEEYPASVVWGEPLARYERPGWRLAWLALRSSETWGGEPA